MMEPFISVIIVSYNHAHLLPRALNACVDQTYKDFEIVIVNNGSTDSTPEVIEQFCKGNPELRIVIKVVKKNIGIANGYYIGLAAATGTYIMYNNADDWMEKDCLEVLAKKVKETEADRVFGLYREVDTKGNELRVVSFEAGMSFLLFLDSYGTIYRRSIFIEIGMIPLDTDAMDMSYWAKFSLYSQKNAFCNKVIYNYLVDPYSISGAKGGWKSIEYIRINFEGIMPIYSTVKDLDTREEIEYMLIKQYYVALLQYNRNNSCAEIIKNYKSTREIVSKYFPDYLKCKKLTLFRNNGDRKSGRRMTWVLSRLEKLHLMKIALCLYVLSSKFTYLRSR